MILDLYEYKLITEVKKLWLARDGVEFIVMDAEWRDGLNFYEGTYYSRPSYETEYKKLHGAFQLHLYDILDITL